MYGSQKKQKKTNKNKYKSEKLKIIINNKEVQEQGRGGLEVQSGSCRGITEEPCQMQEAVCHLSHAT